MKLSAAVAIERATKSAVATTVTSIHNQAQKAAVMNGLSKVYTPRDEAGETYPSENVKVQLTSQDACNQVSAALKKLFRITAEKDAANCLAKAPIIVDGQVLAENVPATYLMFLEKQLDDLNTFVSKMVELDSSDNWTCNQSDGLFRNEKTVGNKVVKVKQALVLYPATEQHPAQTQIVDQDTVVGHWTTQKISGAIPRPRKLQLLERISTLSQAVKVAKDVANNLEVIPAPEAESLLDWIFAP